MASKPIDHPQPDGQPPATAPGPIDDDRGRPTGPPCHSALVRSADRWLERHLSWLIALVLLISVAERIVLFVEIQGTPIANLHVCPDSDMNFFHEWAQRIAAGDWLTSEAFHPHHRWHGKTARRFLEAYPERAAAIIAEARKDDPRIEPEVAIWNHWYGGTQFHQEPLYPYLLACLYRLGGPDVRWMFAIQLLCGCVTNLLVLLIARRRFGLLVGVLAAILACTYSPFLFYEVVLLRASLILFFSVLLVWLALRVWPDQRGWTGWIILGLVAGVSLLLKTTFVLFLAAMTCVALWRWWRRQDHACIARVTLSMIALPALCLMPAVARNLVVGAPPLSLSSVGPITFMGHNLPDSPVGMGFHVAYDAVPAIMAESEGRFAGTVWATLRRHPSPETYLLLLAGKAGHVLHNSEIPNNASIYMAEPYAAILAFLPEDFALLIALGLPGILIALTRRARLAPILSMVLATVLPMILFYVLARFRLPLAALLTPFAGLTLVSLIDWIIIKHYGRLVACLMVISGLLALGIWQRPPNKPVYRKADVQAIFIAGYEQERKAAEAQGDDQRAASLIGRFLRKTSFVFEAYDKDHPPRGELMADLLAWYYDTCLAEITYLEAANLPDQLESARRRAERLREAVKRYLQDHPPGDAR